MKYLPEWLKKLPAGKYTLSDLAKITGKDQSFLSRDMKKYGATYHYIPSEKLHIQKIVFVWEGITVLESYEKL